MRAITASGIVPSAIVGRIRCESAERNAPLSPDEQRVDQHEAGDRRDVVLDRDAAPTPASSRGRTEKNRISSSAHQKIGIE